MDPDRTRADWGAPDYPRPDDLVAVEHPWAEVHHTGVARHAGMAPAEVLADVDRYHRGLGWNGIFYGELIDRQGRLWEARGAGWRSIGSHPAFYDDGTPVDPAALCVVLPGNHSTIEPTPEQLATLRRRARSLPDPRLRWHGLRASTAADEKWRTSCPGDRVIAHLARINARHQEETTMDQYLGTDTRGRRWRFVAGLAIGPLGDDEVGTLRYLGVPEWPGGAATDQLLDVSDVRSPGVS